LARAFNSMLSRLSTQRQELIDTNTILDKRKRFIEAVIESVSAGIIALDDRVNITLINKSAKEILAINDNKFIFLQDIVIPIHELLDEVRLSQDFSLIKEINIKVKGRNRTLLTRVITEHKDNNI